jgi:hypothetical protein
MRRSPDFAVVTARPVVVAVADLPHLGVVCSPRRRSRFDAGSEDRMHIINSMISVVLGLHSFWVIVLIALGG